MTPFINYIPEDEQFLYIILTLGLIILSFCLGNLYRQIRDEAIKENSKQ